MARSSHSPLRGRNWDCYRNRWEVTRHVAEMVRETTSSINSLPPSIYLLHYLYLFPQKLLGCPASWRSVQLTSPPDLIDNYEPCWRRLVKLSESNKTFWLSHHHTVTLRDLCKPSLYPPYPPPCFCLCCRSWSSWFPVKLKFMQIECKWEMRSGHPHEYLTGLSEMVAS